MKTWSFRDRATGAFVDRLYTGPLDGLALNTPEGHEAVEGDHRPAPPIITNPARDIHQKILNAEAQQQPRAVREALLELLPPDRGLRLRALEADIVSLRAALTRKD